MSIECSFRIRCDICGISANYHPSVNLRYAQEYAVESGWRIPAVLDESGKDLCPYCQEHGE